MRGDRRRLVLLPKAGKSPWSQPDPPQRVWEGSSALPRLHSCVSRGREGGSGAAARGVPRPASTPPAFACYPPGCPPRGPSLSSPLQERATKRHPHQPDAGCEVALDWEAPIASQSRNTGRLPGEHHDPGASRHCQGTWRRAATLLGLSCASSKEEKKHPGCFEAVQGRERRGSSGWEGHWCSRTTLQFVLSPLAS